MSDVWWVISITLWLGYIGTFVLFMTRERKRHKKKMAEYDAELQKLKEEEERRS